MTKRTRYEIVKIDLSPNMRAWLCMEALEWIKKKIDKNYDFFEDEDLRNLLYERPHFINGRAALERRGLVDEKGVTTLGWKVVSCICSKVQKLLLETDVTKHVER